MFLTMDLSPALRCPACPVLTVRVNPVEATNYFSALYVVVAVENEALYSDLHPMLTAVTQTRQPVRWTFTYRQGRSTLVLVEPLIYWTSLVEHGQIQLHFSLAPHPFRRRRSYDVRPLTRRQRQAWLKSHRYKRTR